MYLKYFVFKTIMYSLTKGGYRVFSVKNFRLPKNSGEMSEM